MKWEKLTTRKEFRGLGFHDFHAFNLAILGNKVMTNLDSDTILIRIFEVKYSHRDFLGAVLGHNPSYVWRII
jgi:hypothetical protein